MTIIAFQWELCNLPTDNKSNISSARVVEYCDLQRRLIRAPSCPEQVAVPWDLWD